MTVIVISDVPARSETAAPARRVRLPVFSRRLRARRDNRVDLAEDATCRGRTHHVVEALLDRLQLRWSLARLNNRRPSLDAKIGEMEDAITASEDRAAVCVRNSGPPIARRRSIECHAANKSQPSNLAPGHRRDLRILAFSCEPGDDQPRQSSVLPRFSSARSPPQLLALIHLLVGERRGQPRVAQVARMNATARDVGYW